VGCPPGKVPTGRQVGNRLRRFRRRVVGAVYLDIDPFAGRKNGAVWRLYGAPEHGGESGESAGARFEPERGSSGESGESGESATTPFACENRDE